MKEQNLDQLFKDALSNHEADVNPNVWTNIEKGLHAPVSGNTFSGGSSAGKAAGILGKMSVKSLFLISAAAVTVVGTTIYLATKNPETKIEVVAPSAPKNIVQETVSSPVVSSPEVNNNAVISDAKVAANEKPIQQKVKKMESVIASQPKSENRNSSASNKSASFVSSPAAATPAATTPSHKNENSTPSVKPADEKVEKIADSKTESSESQNKVDEQPNVASNNFKATNELVFDTIEKYLVPLDGKKALQNAFIPNSGGLNAYFTVKTTGIKTLEVIIFDRNAKTVYSWKSLDGKWDGKLSDGSDAPPGDYFYSLNAETSEGKICIAQSFLKLFRTGK